jgi:predicted YcjX-like family ATPase
MCLECKNESNFKLKRNRYNSYCNNCQKLYMKEYMRIYRERKRK